MHLILLLALLSCGHTEPANRLVGTTSPYLARHADDPVGWWPWGDEAFARAQAEDKPVLLSIGYATCHWCHVMERESFEDEAIAAFIDAHFVAVKVDREEHPEVDAHYMAAVQALSGRAGWPATLVLTPDGEPIFAASYLPARDGDRPGLRGLRDVLGEVADAWANDRTTLLADARAVSERLTAPPPSPGDRPGPEALHRAARGLLATWDRAHGGFGRAPKFPRPTVLSYLLRYHRRTGDPAARDAALQALRAMATSALYDPIGGGFHRYTVDRAWQTPHFEKVLVDQALLAIAYLEGYQVSGDPELARVARETLDFLMRDLSDEADGFHSAIDADSLLDGALVEGAYYTWTAEDLRLAAGEHADAALAWLEAGEERGPIRARGNVDPATTSGARKALYQARRARSAPAIDDKVITAWNGLAISALARGAFVLDEPAYLHRAGKAAEFVLRHLRADDGTLHRSWRGRPAHPGLLEDYTFLVQGLLDLHEASGDARWLSRAVPLQQQCDARFGAPDGAWYRSATEDPRVPRTLARLDGAEPSGAGVGVLNALRLAELLGDDPWRDRAHAALRALSATAHEEGHAATVLMAAVDFDLDRPVQVVVLGRPQDPDRNALVDVVRRTWLPNRVVLAMEETEARSQAQFLPLLEGKRMRDGATAFVCERGLCEAPTGDPDVLAGQLSRVTPLPAGG